MKATDRRIKIKELLDMYGSVEVSNLSQLLNVSMETIRRDLDIICEEHDIKKIHGGAIKNIKPSTDYFFNKRINKNLMEKRAIAKKAASLIEDGDIIGLDTGTTVLQLVDYIYNKNISIVTCSLPVMTALSKFDISHLKCKIIFLGGEFNENSLSVYGELTLNMLSNLNISKVFLSPDGFSEKSGFSYHNLREGLISKEFINQSKESYMLIDKEKLSKDAFYNIGKSNLINGIISTTPCSDDFKKENPSCSWIIAK